MKPIVIYCQNAELKNKVFKAVNQFLKESTNNTIMNDVEYSDFVNYFMQIASKKSTQFLVITSNRLFIHNHSFFVVNAPKYDNENFSTALNFALQCVKTQMQINALPNVQLKDVEVLKNYYNRRLDKHLSWLDAENARNEIHYKRTQNQQKTA